MEFDSNCRQCKRLTTHLGETKDTCPDYYCQPVPAFGDANAKFLM